MKKRTTASSNKSTSGSINKELHIDSTGTSSVETPHIPPTPPIPTPHTKNASHYIYTGQRTTNLSYLRKGQQLKKTKPNPCILMTGVITTILMTFIYLVTSSLHRTLLLENEEYYQHKKAMSDKKYIQKVNSCQKFITVVLPSVVNPKGRGKRLHSIADTWGPDANAVYVVHEEDEFVLMDSHNSNANSAHNDHSHAFAPPSAAAAAASSSPYSSSTTKNYTFPQTLYVPPDVATVDQGVPRLHYVMDLVYKTYNPDYVFFVNDHTFVIPQHICDFLEQFDVENEKDDLLSPEGGLVVTTTDASASASASHGEFGNGQKDQNIENKGVENGIHQNVHHNNNEEEEEFENNHGTTTTTTSSFSVPNNHKKHHLYAGHALKPKGTKYAFNSGAAGYFLSRDTIQSLLTNQHSPIYEKDCKGERKWLQGNPGLVTANCLKESLELDPIDTRDDLGRYLFHAYGIIRTVKGDFDSWYVNKHATLKEIWGEVCLESVIAVGHCC